MVLKRFLVLGFIQADRHQGANGLKFKRAGGHDRFLLRLIAEIA